MTTSYSVFLGLGSNQQPERHMVLALEALATTFAPLTLSPLYRSVAVGFSGDDFLNAVVGIRTDWSVGTLKRYCTDLEDQFGRDRSQPKFSDRVLDIDLLVYGDWVGTFDGLDLPRDEITRYAHVLKPLADLCPNMKHPGSSDTYAELWASFAGDRHLIPHDLDGWRLSS